MKRIMSVVCLFLMVLSAQAQQTTTTISVSAQDGAYQRTFIEGGFLVSRARAEKARTAKGFYVDAAYDMRHGLQLRGLGEYRELASLPELFTGDEDIQVTGEFRYGALLLYHFKSYGRVRLAGGAGVNAMRHFFNFKGSLPHELAEYGLYNSSVNPTLAVVAGLGKSIELVGTGYLSDTYSQSNLRGWGVDFSKTHRLSERLYIKGGTKFKHWTYRAGYEDYTQSSPEFAFYVGVQVK